MTEQETRERPNIDKELVTETLRDILHEIPAFRAFILQGSGGSWSLITHS